MKVHVERKGNLLKFYDLSRFRSFGTFQDAIFHGTKEGYTDFVLDFSHTEKVYPDGAVPISAFIDLYASEGITFTVKNQSHFVTRSKLVSPVRIGSAGYKIMCDPQHTIFKFEDEGEIAKLVSLFARILSETIVCAKGVVEGFEWCINEVMDNVLQHSDGSPGFVMLQVHKANHQFVICVGDHGQGIFSSLKSSSHRPKTALDAITLAIQPGVTRDPKIGQGNGLWGLSSIVKANTGQLDILSGNASIYYDGQNTKTFELWHYNHSRPGTLVDFRINTNSEINIAEALGGHKPPNLRLEELESPDLIGEHVLSIHNQAHGTGTRRAGAAVRTLVLNTFSEGAAAIVLDFDGTGMVSSSFADEFVGKLVVELGFSMFTERVKIVNVPQTVRSLLDRAVAQRLGASVEQRTEEE